MLSVDVGGLDHADENGGWARCKWGACRRRHGAFGTFVISGLKSQLARYSR